MDVDPRDCEIAAFVGLVLVFEAWERRLPRRRVDRLAGLRLDLLSFVIAILANRLCTGWVTAAVASAGPEALVDALARLRGLPGAARILIALVTVDFVLYWLHRAQHASPWLWRTHAWHHSIEHMYWFAGFRTSLLHSLLYNVPQTAIPMLVLDLSPLQTGVAYAIGIGVQFVEHANVRFGWGWLRHVVISPEYHRIHHAASAFRNRNFAPILPVWDRLFGTWVDPCAVRDDFALGLPEPVEARRVPRMLAGV